MKRETLEALADSLAKSTKEYVAKEIGPLRATILELDSELAQQKSHPPEYLGVFQRAANYKKNQIVTWGGSMFWCLRDGTQSEPDTDPQSWQLCVQRGREGKAGKDAR
jgi:hypothetical protein